MLGRRRGPTGTARRSSGNNNSNAHKTWKETMSESEDSDIGDLASAVADARKRETTVKRASQYDDDTSSESSDMRIMSDSEDKQPKGGETVKSAKKRGETPKTESRGKGPGKLRETKRKDGSSAARSKPKRRKRYAWMDSDESSITESSNSSDESSSSSEDDKNRGEYNRSASLSPTTAERPKLTEKALEEGRKIAARINIVRNQDEFWQFVDELDPKVPMHQGGSLPGSAMAAAVHRLTGFVYQYYHTPQEMLSLVKSRSLRKLTDIVKTGIKRFSHISTQISNLDLTTIIVSVAKLGVHCDKLSNANNAMATSSQKQGLSSNASGTPANSKTQMEVPVIFGAEVVLALAGEARRRGPDAFLQAGLSQLCDLCWGIAKALQCCCNCSHERQNALEFIQHGRKDLDSFYCAIADTLYRSDMDSLTIPDITNICMGFSLARSMGIVSTEKSTLSRPGTMETDEAKDPPAYVLMAKGILPQLRDRLSYRPHAVNALGAPPLSGEPPAPAWQRTGQFRLNPQQTCDITCNLAQMDIYDEQVYNLIGQMAILPRLREFGVHQLRRLRDAFDLVRHDGDYELLKAMRQRIGGASQPHGGRRTGAVIHSETVRYINQREFMRRVQPQPNS
ncbi:hypothetical protein Pmar_PMAR003147 [Perkinsus marinus ATCC 50983]|uniref:Uncharacterized protein n=1 Tax=Perkinsus marinus (strain ATCC 50983 / TXsc) TaxID=423536 RepID=C5L312_PERM5|nr:hypothetical protein Pmar_PMAR003147 [Perkinsus marinus ATCC 50983]EER08899.1 hypothetical protein Pmar_PMAR003147 [Perkinsus marinus ATCC 50983]|eukprot:XP_002777083.1 hypothetical protein Pmar_PMAR003147 [Perkinsus marinus ATCC 50983]